MVILLLAATAVLAGLLVDARRRLAAERAERAADEKHMALLRAGLNAAHEDTRAARRDAAAWRTEAARCGDTYEVVLAPREPQGDASPDAVTEPELPAVDGPGAFARAIAQDPEITEAAAHAGIRVSTGPGPGDRLREMVDAWERGEP